MTLASLGRAARSAAALAVLVSALALSTSGAQAAWLPPVSTSGGLAAADPQVAVDGNGIVTVAWVSGSSSKDISVAEHPAGGEWTNPVSRLSDPVGANSCETPRLAVNSAGAAILVADCGSGATPMRIATRSIFGTWSGTSIEVPGTGEGSDPRLGIDDAGNAVLVWEGPTSTVRSAYRPASSAWSSVTTLSSTAPAENPLEPKAAAANVAMTHDGYAFAIWREKREEPIGTDPVIQVEVARKEKGGAWTASGTLTSNSSTTPVTSGEPQLAINSADQKVVAWRVENPGVKPFAQTRYSFAALAGWNTATNISESPAEVEAVKLAIDGSGRGLATWRSFEAGAFRVKVASTATAGGTWSTPGATLAGPGSLSIGTEPAVAVDPGGDGTVVWRNGLAIEAASRPAAGAFGLATPISSPALPGFSEPVTAMASGGDAVAAWATSTAPTHIAVAVNDVTPPSVSVAAAAPVEVGQPVTLTATATDAWSPVSLGWDFGDGGTATGASVTHAYASAGTKTATVTATDGAGNSSSATATVVVTNPPGPSDGGGSNGSGGATGGSGPGTTPTPPHRIQVKSAAVAQTWAQQAKAKSLSVKCKLDVDGTCAAVANITKAVAKKLGLAVPKGGKPVRIGSGKAGVKAGRFAVVKMKLNAKALAAIAASPQPVQVVIALKGTAAGDDPGTATRRLTLQP